MSVDVVYEDEGLDDFSTIQGAAQWLGMSPSWVSKRISAGELRAIRWGQKVKISRAALLEFVASAEARAEEERARRAQAARAPRVEPAAPQSSVGEVPASPVISLADAIPGLTGRSRKALAAKSARGT